MSFRYILRSSGWGLVIRMRCGNVKKIKNKKKRIGRMSDGEWLSYIDAGRR